MGHHLFSEKFALLETEKGEGMAPIVLEGRRGSISRLKDEDAGLLQPNTGLPPPKAGLLRGVLARREERREMREGDAAAGLSRLVLSFVLGILWVSVGINA